MKGKGESSFDEQKMDSFCALCGYKGSFSRIHKLPDLDTGNPFTILECLSCGVALTVPVPENLASYYEGEVGSVMREEGGWFYRFLRDLQFRIEATRLKPTLPDAVFVDIGCGSGEFAKAIARHGKRVIAADAVSERPQSIQTFPQIGYYRLDYDTGILSGAPSMQGGVAIMRHVLEHIKNPVAFLNSLMKQGICEFYIAVPNKKSWCRKLFGASWYFWDPPRHLWHFDPASLRSFLARLNIKVLAEGGDISPTIVPSIYRYLRVRGAPRFLTQIFGLKSSLNGILGAFQVFLPRNTIWVYGRFESA